MQPTQIAAVRATWARVAPLADDAALLFYARLFELDPSLRHLFAADVRAQAKKLMQTLGVVVASLDRLDTLVPAVEALGRRHVDYGVRDAHYETVGRALLDTLAAALGADFTAEARAAWTEAYVTLSGVMRRAQAEEERAAGRAA